MKERIIEFLRKENKSSATFAQEIGVQPSSVSHIISGRNKPSLDFVVKMVSRYPGLSLEWLIFGKGNMFTSPGITDIFSSIPYIEKNSGQTNIFDEETKSPESIHETADGRKQPSGRPPDIRLPAVPGRAKKIIILYEDDSFTEHYPSGE